MAETWFTKARPCSPSPCLSIEVEKPSNDPEKLLPLLRICSHAFFSREFIEANHVKIIGNSQESSEPATKKQRCDLEGEKDGLAHLALTCMQALSARVGQINALWVCPWGSTGAFALDTASGCSYFEPAQAQVKVVDSVGAG